MNLLCLYFTVFLCTAYMLQTVRIRTKVERCS